MTPERFREMVSGVLIAGVMVSAAFIALGFIAALAVGWQGSLIGAAADYGTPGFLVPLADTELFRWCLSRGLRVFFVLNMLTLGLYEEPRGAYMPSVGY